MSAPFFTSKLEDQDREQLLTTARTLLAEVEALSGRIAAVNEIGIAINRKLNLDEILRVVGKQSKWLLDFEHCSVCLQDTKQTWHITTLFGSAFSFDCTNIMEAENIGHALKTGQSMLIRSGADAQFLKGYSSQIIIPLESERNVMGSIQFASKRPNIYTQEDLRIGYLLALQLSAAIRNAHHFQELHQAQEDLRRYSEELEARNQELDAYSHTIAHDLKAPLSIINMRAYLVEKSILSEPPPKVREHLEGIKTSANSMANMIDQLLWLAKLRDTSEVIVPVDIQPIVNAAIARFENLIESRNIQIEITGDFPSVMGQCQWLEEVFANLISNAIKYMGDNNPAPHIIIKAVQKTTTCCYQVQDNGVGIAPEKQADLFKMFTRLHTIEAEGLGLGLSIVSRIINRLNGNLGINSQPGVGSTFWFELPLADESQTTA